MLLLSESASTAIRNLMDRPELPDTSGLRIAPAEGQSGRLGVSTAGMPEEGDQVIEDQGARVFLEPAVATMLEDQVLEATADEQGRIGFALSPQ